MSIGIISTGFGNLASIQRIIEKLGGQATHVNTVADLARVGRIVLPGVGHFDEGVRSLRASGLVDQIVERVKDGGMPLLGICLGMQLLCRGSEEGFESGLGLIEADVKKFCFPADAKLKVPHMGWNVVKPTRPNALIPLGEEEQRFYFVHSYRVVPDDPSVIIGAANYGSEFCAAFQKANIIGVQFHPEKSHRFGMALMNRFMEL
jgi:glutamine amidotransferase